MSALECALNGGHLAGMELTGAAGLSEDESHGQTTWGRSIGVPSNPFVYVANLDVADTGHVPWPAWAVELVCKTAWPDLVRMVRLALATCQRESDLIRMGLTQRERQGLCPGRKRARQQRSLDRNGPRFRVLCRDVLLDER